MDIYINEFKLHVNINTKYVSINQWNCEQRFEISKAQLHLLQNFIYLVHLLNDDHPPSDQYPLESSVE